MNTTNQNQQQLIKPKYNINSIILCILFALWFLVIPLIVGIVLLIIQSTQKQKMNKYIKQLEDFKCNYEKNMTPELQRLFDINTRIEYLQRQENEYQCKINQLETVISDLNTTIDTKKKSLIVLDEEILVQDFGLYKPQYEFANSLDYKEALADVRQTQKDLIKQNNAVTGRTDWTVNGNATKGKKMVSDTQKLLLRAFNTECDEIISKVKYTNFDASLNRIYKSAEAISKLGTIMSISIKKIYLDAKVKELRLAFEYQLKKQQEKEELRAAREEQREQAKIQKEIENEKRKIEKEQTHYQTAYEKIIAKLNSDPNSVDLLEKKAELELKLNDINTALEDIDYRQANMKAGYVYIISNIGAFGENVFKIGMTRRLEPQERIDELGDASVPFKFDVHAMIFSDDAPALEAALHRAFKDKKVNMVNQRREFFNVSLDEIKKVVKENYDKTVEFIDVPDAEQYRISMKMRESA